MRIRSKLKSAELDLTPMIDVVFLLIVFFTLVINFTAADQDERIKLPVSELAQPPEKPPTEQITLHVLTTGNIIYGGKEYALTGLQKEIEHRLWVLKIMNVSPDKVTVIVRADAQCESGQVLNVVELCQKLNLVQFVLRTKQRKE
jgi:biopolymer transport protein ExbD